MNPLTIPPTFMINYWTRTQFHRQSV